MRVTDRILTRNIINDIQRSFSEIAQKQRQIATGKAFQNFSDDPLRASKSLDLKTSVQTIKQFQKNIDGTIGWVDTTLAGLAQARDVVSAAKIEALNGANSTLSSQAREASAAVVASLREQLLGIANTRFNGSYVFGGQRTTTPAFSTSGVYQGDQGQIQRSIAPAESVTVNITGQQAFTSAGDIFQVLQTLETALRNDDIPGIEAQITNLDAVFDNVLQIEASLGAELERVNFTKTRLDDTEITLLSLQIENDDIESARAIVELQSIQNTYQAALQSSTQILQQTLFRFLG